MSEPAIGSKWRHRIYGLTATVLSVHGRTATIMIEETRFTTRVDVVGGALNGYRPLAEVAQ